MTEIELTARIEKLERDSRRFKRLGTAALVLAAALGFMAATRPVPDVIKAHEFEVVDSGGIVRDALRSGAIKFFDGQGKCRAEMGKYSGGPPFLELTGKTGKVDLGYLAVGLPSMPSSVAFPAVWLVGASGKLQAGMMLGRAGPTFELSDRLGYPNVSMSDTRGEPLISLSDTQGFRMDLGSTNTTNVATGATQQSSADSIIMFGNDKDHRVIWKAP